MIDDINSALLSRYNPTDYRYWMLMANHPDMRVIAWIDTDEISDDYSYLAGNIYEPHIETLIIGKDDMYHEKEDSPYDDCCHYYG